MMVERLVTGSNFFTVFLPCVMFIFGSPLESYIILVLLRLLPASNGKQIKSAATKTLGEGCSGRLHRINTPVTYLPLHAGKKR